MSDSNSLPTESVITKGTLALTSAHFISMVSACLVMLTAGSIYVFSLWGTEFATELHLTQFQTSFVAAAGNNGLYLSAPIVGYLVDHYTKYSYLLLIVGGSLIYSGYGLLTLSFYKHIEAGYILLALFNTLVGIGSSCCYGYSLATNVRNWPATHRGLAVGGPVAVFGLGAFMYSQIIRWFFFHEDGIDIRGSLQMMGGFALVVNIICSFLLKDQRSLNQKMEESLVTQQETEELLLHSSEISIPESILFERSFSEEAKHRRHSSISHDSSIRIISQTEVEDQVESDISIFTSIDAYLLGSVLLLCAGIGLMYVNNCGAIIDSLMSHSVESEKYQSIHVAEMSISSFAGRLFAGSLSDVCTNRFKLSRLFWPFLSAFFLFMGSLYGGWVLENISQLYTETFLIGFGYGILWTGIPVLVGRYFGMDNFAYNWGWFQVLPAFGGQMTSAIYGLIVDSCTGSLCFSKSFQFTAGSSGLAIICIGILYNRSKHTIHNL